MSSNKKMSNAAQIALGAVLGVVLVLLALLVKSDFSSYGWLIIPLLLISGTIGFLTFLGKI